MYLYKFEIYIRVEYITWEIIYSALYIISIYIVLKPQVELAGGFFVLES